MKVNDAPNSSTDPHFIKLVVGVERVREEVYLFQAYVDHKF